MGFGTPPTVLEGDYSTWTIYDTFEDTNAFVGLWPQFGIFNKDETTILIMDINSDVVKRYTIATKSLSASIITLAIFGDTPWATELCIKSIQDTYVAVIEDYVKLHILKDGVIVKTLTDSDLGFVDSEILTASISPSGKYIAVSGQLLPADPVKKGWVVLEGS